MSDEKFEQFLQREAQSYNEPPSAVPRDEMFMAITAARGKQDRGPKTEDRARAIRYAMIGMAATLVMGVAIGRYALTRHEAAVPGTLATNAGGRANVSPADSKASGRPNGAPADSSAATYTVAATEQLARAEALLTAYSASRANSGVDKQLSSWARDILTNTRLLLDSPAADDPARRRLLRDLELVLVQMVQRSPADGAADERSQIDRSLKRTQVLPRLRSALPAGRNSGI